MKKYTLGILVIINIITLGLLYLSAATSEKTKSTIEANKFVLVDEKGRMRAAIEMGKIGEPWLTLFDEDKRPIAGLLGFEGGSALFLRDKKDEPKSLELSVSEKGTFMDFKDSPNDPRIMLGSSVLGPQIFILDDNKQYLIAFGIKKGEPLFKMKNAKGEELYTKP